jgi:hypothetical protein
MSLSTWSYPFYEDNVPIDKRATSRKKINQTVKKIDSEDDDLADFKPIASVPQVPVEPPVVQEEPIPVMSNYPIPSSERSSSSSLSEKINYMIQLLEEQKDEKTGRVTEEIILYIFLGIFVIFVLDSFVKTGKYSR